MEKVAVDGNSDVVNLLEQWLARARLGKINYAAVTVCEPPAMVGFDFAGCHHMEEVAAKAVEIGLLPAMRKNIHGRKLPPSTGQQLGADYVCYNLATGPIAFDFLVWLVDAEMTRIREGAPPPLKVAFWRGLDDKLALAYPGYKEFFANVMRPALALVGAIEDRDALKGRCKEVYVTRDIVAACRAGEWVPLLAPSEAARATVASFLDKPPVTITLRENPHWEHRNSNLDAWTRFARDLQGRGEDVIFVRDTAKAQEPLRGFKVCPTAAIDLDVRAALYDAAKANLFTSNGPAIVAVFGDKPFLKFVHLEQDGHPYYPNTPAGWLEHSGFSQGEQYPWSRGDQRIVWSKDTYESIVDAWGKFIQPLTT